MFRGRAAKYSMLGAETHVGGVDFALNQRLTGPSIYDEYLLRRGVGLHHIACMANSQAGVSGPQTLFETAGVDVAMAGRIDGTIAFRYYDTEPLLAVSVETGTGHAISLTPDRVFDTAEEHRRSPTPIDAVTVVVEDLEASMRSYSELLGWDGWTASNIAQLPISDVRRRGKVLHLSGRMAYARVGAVTVELVEPGRDFSVERTTLDAVGPGLNHVTCTLSTTEMARIRGVLRDNGAAIVMSGRLKGYEFWYLSTTPRLKLSFDPRLP